MVLKWGSRRLGRRQAWIPESEANGHRSITLVQGVPGEGSWSVGPVWCSDFERWADSGGGPRCIPDGSDAREWGDPCTLELGASVFRANIRDGACRAAWRIDDTEHRSGSRAAAGWSCTVLRIFENDRSSLEDHSWPCIVVAPMVVPGGHGSLSISRLGRCESLA